MPTGRAVLHTLRSDLARQHGVISGRQLQAGGASPKAIEHLRRSGALLPAGEFVFTVPGSADTWHRQLWVALLDRRTVHTKEGQAAVARRSAAALHRLPGFPAQGVDLLVHERASRHLPPRRAALADVRATSWLPPGHVTSVEGLPTTTLARTLFDLAGLSTGDRRRRGLPHVHPKRVERTLDTALARGLDLASVADVVATLGTRGRPGTALMRQLLDERGEGYVATESELEDLLLSVLAAHDVPPPERQVDVGDDELPIGRIDFLYRGARLVIEADSRRHHSALADWTHDRRRDARLAAAGWRVIRVTWHDLVHRPDEVVAIIRQALRNSTAA